MSLKVYKPGLTVYLGKPDAPVEGKVLSVQIKGETNPLVLYEVVWWEGASRNIQWISEDEINIEKEPTVDIGFKIK